MTQLSSTPSAAASAQKPGTGTLLADIVVVAIGAVSLAVLSAFFDARTAQAVTTLPAGLVDLAGYTSALGLSGYMFAISGALLFGTTAALRIAAFRIYAAALIALRERALYIVAVLAISGLAAQLIKHLVGRARPRLMDALGPYHFDLLSLKASLASFPSGHTTTVFAMAVALTPFAPRWRLPLFGLATLIGLSRILVHAHYISDVAAGAILGIATALATTWLFADWSLAFEREGATICLKEPGLLVRTFGRSAPAV